MLYNKEIVIRELDVGEQPTTDEQRVIVHRPSCYSSAVRHFSHSNHMCHFFGDMFCETYMHQ